MRGVRYFQAVEHLQFPRTICGHCFPASSFPTHVLFFFLPRSAILLAREIVAKAFKGPKMILWTWSGQLRFGLATACQSDAGEVAVRDLQLRLAALEPADHLPGKVGRANGVKEPVVRCAWKDPFTDAQLLDEAHVLKLHGVHEKLHLGRSQAQPEANPLPPSKKTNQAVSARVCSMRSQLRPQASRSNRGLDHSRKTFPADQGHIWRTG